MSKKHEKATKEKPKKTAEKPAKKKKKKKKKKNGKPSESKKKRAADAMSVCPCCKKHCSLYSPKCGKGKKLAKKLGLAAC